MHSVLFRHLSTLKSIIGARSARRLVTSVCGVLLLVSCHPSANRLHSLFDSGRTDRVIAAIRNGADPDSKDSAGATILNRAIGQSALDVVRAALEAGAAPDSDDTWQPLEIAIRYGNAQAARLLLEAGADPGKRDYLEFIFDDSIGLDEDRQLALAATLLEYNVTLRSLVPIVESGNHRAVRLFVDSGVDPNRVHYTPSGPLHPLDVAIDALANPLRRQSALLMAEAIILGGGRGIRIDRSDYDRVIQFGSSVIIETIREWITFTDDGRIVPILPLWEAIEQNNYDAVKAAIRAGADPDIMTAGRIPQPMTFYAARQNALAALLESGIDSSLIQ